MEGPLPPLLELLVAIRGCHRRLGFGAVALFRSRSASKLLTATTVTGNTAFTSGVTSFLAGPLVRSAFLVSGLAALACDLALLGGIH